MLINFEGIDHKVTNDELQKLSSDNPDTKFETTKERKLIVMSPTGSNSGRKNTRLIFQVELWNSSKNLGVTFDSSTGFTLSNGAVKSPDVSWIELTRWQAVPESQQDKFAPIDPDFVIELMSPTDKLEMLREKMEEYIDCGVKLGWLINPSDKQVEIYRSGQDKEVLTNPQSLSGEDVCSGLTVDLTDIF